MQRWFVLFVVALLVMPSVVLGQATPQTFPSFNDALAAVNSPTVATASDTFSGAYAAKDGLYGLTFIAMRFADDASASRALSVPIDYFSVQRFDPSIGHQQDIRLTQVADDQRVSLRTFDTTETEFLYASFRIGSIVLYAETNGAGVNVASAFMEYVGPTIDRLRSTDPQTDEALLATLPAIDQMPEGFTEEGPIDPEFEPVPTPTPAIQTPAAHFATAGVGNTNAAVGLLPGIYTASFACDVGGGSVTLAVVGGRPTTVADDPVAYTLSGSGIALYGRIVVTCDGKWTLTLEPT